MKKLVAIIPVYNERESLPAFLKQLFASLSALPSVNAVHILLIDDHSTDGCMKVAQSTWEGLGPVSDAIKLSFVRLPANQGHQRALAVGFRYAAHLKADYFLVMDGDGQDDPQVVAEMTRKLENADIVFAKRAGRAEGLLWRLMYYCYQALCKVVAGRTLAIGNFSIFKEPVLNYLCQLRSVNHLGAQLLFSPFTKDFVAVRRLERLSGKSRMGLGKLVDFAVSALTSDLDIWVALFTRLTFLIAAASGFFLVVILYLKWFTDLAIPGWASTMGLLLVLTGLQSFGLLILISFLAQVLRLLLPDTISLLAKKSLMSEQAPTEDREFSPVALEITHEF